MQKSISNKLNCEN